MFYLINNIKDLQIKKLYFILTLFIFLGLAFTLGTNTTDALACSYTPIRQPPFDKYSCFDSGTCDTYAPGSGTACTGEWTNCTQYANSVTGERWMSCSCSTSCQSTGRTVSSSSCGSSNTCSYSYGNICNGGNITGGNCVRVTPLDSNGNPVSGGPGDPPESVCNSAEFSFGAYGGTSFTTYAGDSTYLSFQYSTSGGAKNLTTEVAGCPAGSTCTGTTTEWVAPSDGTLIRGKTISPNTTVPGTYNISIKAYVAENPECAKYANYTVTVKPSRKMVCDGGWYDIPPNPIGYSINSGPLALWNNGSQAWDKYIKATYNGAYLTSQSPATYGNANFSTRCTYLNGMTDFCTWELPSNMPNTGSNGYSAVPGWSMDTSGPYGSGTSVTDSNNRTIELRRNGSSFQYKCSVNSPSTVAVCDNTWRYLHDRGASDYQPVGAYLASSLDSQYKDAVLIAVGGRGATTNAYVQSCKFNGTNTCTFDSGWTGIGAVTSQPLNISVGWSPEVNLKTTWAGGEWVKNINRTSGWSGWVNQGSDNGVLWGQPYRFQDKLGRYWQLRNASGGIAYACGTNPVCVGLNFNSTRSSISKSNLSANEAFTVKCDYGVRGIDAVGVTTGGGASCAFASWDSGNSSRTTANFNCTAGSTGGTFPISCTNVAGSSSNICAQSNTLGNITVSAPPSAVADINANPLSVPYNSPSTITWSSSNATSCSVSPTGWIGTSGSQSSGNLTTSRTYSLDCLPSGPNSSDTVTVNVQAAQTFTLNVIRSGQGTVTSNPSGINCGSTCSASYVQNTSVTLIATPASGRIFTGWGGACSGKGTCTVIINASKTVYANFAVDPNFKEF